MFADILRAVQSMKPYSACGPMCAIALGARTYTEIAEATGQSPDTLTRALRYLLAQGKIRQDAALYVLRPEGFPDAEPLEEDWDAPAQAHWPPEPADDANVVHVAMQQRRLPLQAEELTNRDSTTILRPIDSENRSELRKSESPDRKIVVESRLGGQTARKIVATPISDGSPTPPPGDLLLPVNSGRSSRSPEIPATTDLPGEGGLGEEGLRKSESAPSDRDPELEKIAAAIARGLPSFVPRPERTIVDYVVRWQDRRERMKDALRYLADPANLRGIHRPAAFFRSCVERNWSPRAAPPSIPDARAGRPGRADRAERIRRRGG